MPRKRLNYKQIKVLAQAVLGVAKRVAESNVLLKKLKITAKIKQIQIPAALSESIALNLLSDGILSIPGYKPSGFQFGTKKKDYDIKWESGENPRLLNIEVKATGTDTFQRFRKKAMNSDYTVWIDFAGLRKKPMASDNRIYFFKTTDVFNLHKNEIEKEVNLIDLIEAKQISDSGISYRLT